MKGSGRLRPGPFVLAVARKSVAWGAVPARERHMGWLTWLADDGPLFRAWSFPAALRRLASKMIFRAVACCSRTFPNPPSAHSRSGCPTVCVAAVVPSGRHHPCRRGVELLGPPVCRRAERRYWQATRDSLALRSNLVGCRSSRSGPSSGDGQPAKPASGKRPPGANPTAFSRRTAMLRLFLDRHPPIADDHAAFEHFLAEIMLCVGDFAAIFRPGVLAIRRVVGAG